MRYVLIACLCCLGCRESAEQAHRFQERNREEFDSINATLKASNAAVSEDPKDAAPSTAQRMMDSFLNETEAGKKIKIKVQQERDSLTRQQERDMNTAK